MEEKLNKPIFSLVHQKRLEVQERIKEKLNDSYTGFQGLTKTDKTPKAKQERNPSSFKQQMLEIAGQLTAREPSSNKAATSGEFSNKSYFQSQISSQPDKGKSKFENILNSYFSALPSKLASPSKELMVKKQGIYKEALEIKGGEVSPKSKNKRKPVIAEAKSPILKFKELYDTMSKNNQAKPPIQASRPAMATPANKRSSLPIQPKEIKYQAYKPIQMLSNGGLKNYESKTPRPQLLIK